MAYARQADPILQSLSEVGQNMNRMSGDILTRRRLDLTEGQQIAEAERERNLQGLRAQALQQEGQVKVLETTGKLAEVGQRMEMDQKRFGLETEKHALQQRIGEFTIREGEALLPGKLAEQQSGIMLRKAQAAGVSAGTRVNNLQAKQMETSLAQQNTPLSPGAFAAMAEIVGGEAGRRIATEVIQPGEIKTVGSALFAMKMIEQADPKTTNEITLNRLTELLPKLKPGTPEHQAAEQQYQMALQNAGRAGSRPRLDNHQAYIAALDQTYNEANQALNTGDAYKARAFASQILDARTKAPLHLKPEQLDALQAQEHPVFAQFDAIAKKMTEAVATREGFDQKDPRFAQAIQQFKEDLAVNHGTMKAYNEYVRLLKTEEDDKKAKGKPGSAMATTPGITPDAPMTPQLQRIREVQEQKLARESQVQGQQIETESRKHFKRLTTGQNLELSGMAGLIQSADDLRAAEDLYVQIRRQNPTLGAGPAMQQLRQQLSQGR